MLENRSSSDAGAYLSTSNPSKVISERDTYTSPNGATVTLGSAGGGGGGLSKSDQIAIGVGVGGGVISLLGVIIAWVQLRRRRNNRRNMSQALNKHKDRKGTRETETGCMGDDNPTSLTELSRVGSRGISGLSQGQEGSLYGINSRFEVSGANDIRAERHAEMP